MSKKAMLLGALFAAAILVSGQVYAEEAAAPKADAQTEQTAEGQPAPETEASAEAAAAASVEPAAGEAAPAPEGDKPAAAEEIKLPRKGN